MKLIGIGDQFVQFVGLGVVAMGIMDFLDDEDGDDVEPDGGDELFGDGMGEDVGDDFGGMDDGMDDWADGDDEFGGDGEATGSSGALENRVDELENEVADISSTIGTVRSENEQISATVEETEENVRKLLEIYEMVTRGVNPFVDDVQQGGGAGGGGEEGGFGLLDGDGADEEETDLDEDVADAEPESFFDDDLEDDGDDPEGDLGIDPPDEGTADAERDGPDSVTSDDEGGQADGSTFAELKEEYDSGDAEWAGETAGPDGRPDADGGDGEFEFRDPETADLAEPADPPRSSDRRGKPYLADLPGGFAADLVVMEWLEFLVTEFGPEDAVRTIGYYGDIGWISESVEDELLAFVSGFADVDDVDDEGTGPATLEVDDHVRSLTFLSRLTGDVVEQRIVEHCARIRGGSDGLQR